MRERSIIVAKRLNYEIGFTGDTKQLQQAIDTAVKSLQKLGTNSSFQLTSDLKEASKSALDLATNLQKAVNQNTGKLDLIDFEKSLKASGKSLSVYADELSKLGPTGQQAFLNVASAITQAELPLKRSNKLMTELWVTMKNTARWQLTSSALHGFMGALSTAYGYTKDLDRSLNNIRIVSGQSAEEMKEFAEQANKAAKALSSTTTDYTDAALIYYQQGLDAQQVEERTNATIKMANVTGDTAQTVSDQMTAIWNNYDDGSKSLEYYADVITALGAATASSSGEIAQGLEKFSAIAGQVGLSYEYATSALATVTATTRESADVVGTAFKTLFARIQGLSLGETMDDGTNLNKYSEALQKVGISIFEQNGQLKAMDKILDEMGSKWSTLSNAQQVALAQTVAGVRQYNQLMTLMGNWDFFQENLAAAQGSEGELQKQADIYAESWEAARERVRASAEDIYDSIINPDLFIELDNTLTPILSTVADLIDGMGGLEGAATIAAYAFTKLYGPQIQEGLRKTYDNIRLLTGAAQATSRERQGEAADLAGDLPMSYTADKALQNKIHLMKQEVALQGTINQYADQLTQEQLKQINNERQVIDLLKTQATDQASIMTTLQNELSALRGDIEIDVHLEDNWQATIENELGLNSNRLNELFGTSQINGATDAVEKLTNRIKDISKHDARLNIVRSRFTQLKNSTEVAATELQDLAKQFNNLSKEEIDAIQTTADFERILERQRDIARTGRVDLEDMQRVLTHLGADSTQIQNYVNKLRQLKQVALENQWTTEQLDRAIEDLQQTTIANAGRAATDWAAKLTNASNALMQVGMGISALQSIGRVFTDDNLSDIERLNQLLMSSAMLIPLIGTIGKHVPTLVMTTGAYQVLSAAVYEFAIAQVNGAAATEAEVAGLLQKRIGLAATTILQKKYTEAEIAALTATQKFNAILLASMPYVVAVAAVIGAVVIAYDHFNVSVDEARESIQKANEAYEEEKQKLDELNSSLETTKNRIEELENKGSLTIVEQEELSKLRTENQLLENQIAIQEKLAQTARQNQVDTIADNFKISGQDLIASTGAIKGGTINAANGAGDVSPEIYKKYHIDEKGLKQGTEAYEEAFAEYRRLREEDSENRKKWVEENRVDIQQFEQDYVTLVQASLDDDIVLDDKVLSDYQTQLKAIRQQAYTEQEYLQLFIQPVLDSNAMAKSKERFITALKDEENNLERYLNEDVKEQLLVKGISVEDYINTLQSEMTELKDFLQTSGISDIDKFLKDLSAEDIEIMMSLDLQGFESFKEFYKQYLEIKNGVSITVQLETAKDSALNAFKLLSEGEFLTDEQVLDLQQKFAGIFDLSNLGDLSMYDQARKLGEAYVAAAFPDDVFNTTKEKFLNLQEEWSKLDAKSRRGLTDEEQTIKAQLELEMEDAYDKLEELNDFELDPKEIEIAGIEGILAQMGALEKATSLIGEGLKVEAENVAELMKTMPELFEDSIVSVKDGSVQLSQAIVNAVSDAANQEIAITKESLIAQLQARIQATSTTIDAIKMVKSQAISASKDTALSEIADNQMSLANKREAVRAIIKAKIEQAIQERSQSAQAASSAVQDQNKVTDAAETEGQATATNWNLAAKQIEKDLYKAFSNAASYQAAFARGDKVIGQIGGIGGIDVSGFKGGSSETSWDYDLSAGDRFDALQEYLDNDFAVEKGLRGAERRDAIAQIQAGLKEIGYDNFTNDQISKAGGESFIDAFIGAYESTDAFVKDLNTALSNEQYNLASDTNDLSRLFAGISNIAGLKGAGAGKGGGSSKSAKDESEKLERYHEINRTLEDQERLLSELETQAERTFGLDRLKLYEKELEEINKKAAYEQMKMAEAGTYLDKDIQAIRDLGLNVQVDAETREITNWTAIMNQATAEYKAAIAGATDEEAQAVKDMYDNRIKAIEQYEESIDTFQEQQQKVWDALREARDAELRNTTYKLDVLLNVKNMKDAARDFSKEVVESFSDELYHGRESAELGAQGARAEMALLGEYQQQQADLQKLLDNADEFTNTEEIIAEMEELQGNVIASGEALLDWIETVETMLPEAIDAARERFNLFTDQLDHNTSVLDTIKELLALQGVSYKTNREFNTLQRVSQEKLDAAVASAELQKDWFENARTELLEAQRALEQVEEGDAAYDTLKNNRDALLEEYNSAQEAMLESAKEAMEVAREMFLAEIEKASYDFSQAISDGLGLDFLQERYDHLIEEEERYLDEVNTTYEQLKWNSKLQTAIDEASSQATKNQLAVLKEEFEQRKKNNEISQYDVDILNAKYEMIQKQIALEEAQNNKSQVRLVRNSQGNWDYQYTSDQSAIDDANAEYADAANEYYNIAKDQVKDITEEIVATWQECNDRIKEIYEDETLTVAEREEQIVEIRQFYSDKILYLEEQKNNALKDMTAAGGEIIGEYGNTYQDVIDLMQDGTEDFNEAFNDYLDDMEDAWNDYDETVGDVADSTGTSMEDLKDIIDDVSESTDDCREVGEELSEMMWEQIDDIHDLSQEYADWAEEIYGVVEALRALAVAQGQAAEDAAQESGDNRDTTSSKGGYNASLDYAQVIGAGVQNGWLSDGEVAALENERDAKIKGEGLRDKYSNNVDWDSVNIGNISKEQWEKLLDKTVSLNTGGYTGDFSDSKLAFLHEKELVLNQSDTGNILTAVNMVRVIGPTLFKQIENMLDNNAIAGANLLDMKMISHTPNFDNIQNMEQQVFITAEFPDATVSSEIEEAFNILINEAAQRASVK